MGITIERGNSGPAEGRRVRLTVWVGAIILAMSVALGVFIRAQSRDPSPPEEVYRAIAIPALCAAIGLLAVIAGLQRRPTIVIATGILCFVGSILSIATLEFLVPGIALVGLGSRIEGQPWRHLHEAAIACAATLFVIGAGVGLLSTTDSGVLTGRGDLIEAVLLVGALGLVALTGRSPGAKRILASGPDSSRT